MSHGCGRRTSPARASVRRPDRAEEGDRGALGVSLVEAYPQVAAMWLQERNGGLTPQKATPKMQVAVWWRCAARHEWEERISNRTAMPKWKNGDVAACHECVGYRVSHTFPMCGHTARVRALAPFGQEATEPTGGQVGVAAEVRWAVLRLVDEVITVRAGVPAQHGQ
ncbi:zinc-ribbon domain-containing protein [Streptomyces sp. WAC00263]|uniref:zinc-ribbon domain-containing protein n=1 Tax=Streptomyces sp. WAC00263 TaxID=1917422 RepID=UPI00240F483C|nr:zinc-ribbon domain-containing protein [Streptomyces sp. WAC00263]